MVIVNFLFIFSDDRPVSVIHIYIYDQSIQNDESFCDSV